MTMLIGDFLDVLERLAPASLAEEWDNVGLQLGSRLDEVGAVLLALNVTAEVLEEAVTHDCGLILTHHPLIFQPLASASDDSETGRLIRRASREGIGGAAAHTNLDSAKGGLADVMAGLMELQQVKPLVGAAAGCSKLVAFVPAADLDRVRASLFAAGAGVIGDYQHCSYSMEGTGTFLPLEGAKPTIGEVGRDEKVAELRLEMIFPSDKVGAIVDALLAAHSYEEPAYDIYPLETKRRDAGSGRVGELPGEVWLKDFAGSLAELFGLGEARFVGDPDTPIRRVALVPGSGADFIPAAARLADVLVTGDYKYHNSMRAHDLGLALIDLPHEVSEHVALKNWLPRLEGKLAKQSVKVLMSSSPVSFWHTVTAREARYTATAQEARHTATARQVTSITGEEEKPIKEKPIHQLHVDGGARGNPGPAGIGAVLAGPNGKTMETIANYIGEATNNVAEYRAMISGLELALDRGLTRLAIFSDSELIVRQLEGAYKVKNEGLRPYYEQAKSLLSRLDDYELKSIPREDNAHADELVNRALDDAGH